MFPVLLPDFKWHEWRFLFFTDFSLIAFHCAGNQFVPLQCILLIRFSDWFLSHLSGAVPVSTEVWLRWVSLSVVSVFANHFGVHLYTLIYLKLLIGDYFDLIPISLLASFTVRPHINANGLFWITFWFRIFTPAWRRESYLYDTSFKWL